MNVFVCRKCGNLIKKESKMHECSGEEIEERNFAGDFVQDADFVLSGGGNRKYDVL